VRQQDISWTDNVGRRWRVQWTARGYQLVNLVNGEHVAAWSDGRSLLTFNGAVGLGNLLKLVGVAMDDANGQ